MNECFQLTFEEFTFHHPHSFLLFVELSTTNKQASFGEIWYPLRFLFSCFFHRQHNVNVYVVVARLDRFACLMASGEQKKLNASFAIHSTRGVIHFWWRFLRSSWMFTIWYPKASSPTSERLLVGLKVSFLNLKSFLQSLISTFLLFFTHRTGNSSPGHLIFFLIPVGIQITANVVLFIITAIHCNRVKAEIHRMQMNDNDEQKKKRFIADKAM